MSESRTHPRLGEGDNAGHIYVQFEPDGSWFCLTGYQPPLSRHSEVKPLLDGTLIAVGAQGRITSTRAGRFQDEGLELVSQFHEAFGIAQPEQPTIPLAGRSEVERFAHSAAVIAEWSKQVSQNFGGLLLLIRLQLIQEELAELAQALAEGDRTKVLDALADLSYVVDGTWLALGYASYKLEAIREVHRSNSSKLDADGRPIIGASGRVEKSNQYRPPNLESILGPHAGRG